jgi:membrane-associated phospholipid phosphatase
VTPPGRALLGPRQRGAVALLCLLIAALPFTLDRPLALAVTGAAPAVKALFQTLTVLGESHWYLVPTGLVFLALYLDRRLGPQAPRRTAADRIAGRAGFVFGAVALSGIAADVIKPLLGRARPKLLLQDGVYGLNPLSFRADYYSFPSGHANTMFALALALGFLAPRLRWPMLVLAAAVALSRVMVGAHYLSDVLGGALLAGLVTLWLRAALARRGLVFRLDEDGLPRLS